MGKNSIYATPVCIINHTRASGNHGTQISHTAAEITALPVHDDIRSTGAKRTQAEWAEPLDPAAWQDADYVDGWYDQADD